MVPDKRRRRSAWDARAYPIAVCITPHVPDAAIPDVALRSKNPPFGAVGLVGVKLQGLGCSRICQIEIHVILKVGGSVNRAQLLPPESVRVRGGSAEAEFY